MRTNAERAERAEAALLAYIDHTGDSRRANELATWIGDLMCDLRHLCAFTGERFPEHGGEMNFEAECTEEPTGAFEPSLIWLMCDETDEPGKAYGELAECQNCEWLGPVSLLAEIENISMRVDAGEPMPAGECPECGALAHITKQTKVTT